MNVLTEVNPLLNASTTKYRSSSAVLNIIHLPCFLNINNVSEDGSAYVPRNVKGIKQIRPPGYLKTEAKAASITYFANNPHDGQRARLLYCLHYEHYFTVTTFISFTANHTRV
jgi:hypothetical protein